MKDNLKGGVKMYGRQYAGFQESMENVRLMARNFRGFEVADDYEIDRIIYNNPATIVYFKDGSKSVAKCNAEEFDKEKGVAMAIIKRLYTRGEFKRMVDGGEELCI